MNWRKFMEIEVVRIGQRLVRDDRVTTHVALVARAFGASRIYMNEINQDLKETMTKINDNWGGDFPVVFKENLRNIVKKKKLDSFKIVHLTMYGENINEIENSIKNEEKILVVVGAEKVPREIYELADYNIAIGNQPHSEISALGIFLDRIQEGKQLTKKFPQAKRRIIPTKQGKKVIITKTRD